MMKIDTDRRTLQQLADAIEVTEYEDVEELLDNELRVVDHKPKDEQEWNKQ